MINSHFIADECVVQFFYYVLIYVFLNKWYIIVDLIVRLTNRPIVKAIGIEAISFFFFFLMSFDDFPKNDLKDWENFHWTVDKKRCQLRFLVLLISFSNYWYILAISQSLLEKTFLQHCQFNCYYHYYVWIFIVCLRIL